MKEISLCIKDKETPKNEHSFPYRDRDPVSLCIGLSGCHPRFLHSEQGAKDFVLRLCTRFEMQRFGECAVLFFSGSEKEMASGYSAVQFCKEALITAHFVDINRTIYLNIFSFRKLKFEKKIKIILWCKEFLHAKELKLK